MRQTLCRPSKGFWSRSLDELRRLSIIAVRSEGVKGPSGPYELQSFRDAESVADCKIMTDSEIGGFSTADIDWVSTSSHSSSLWSATATSTTAVTPPPIAKTTPPYSSYGGFIRFHGNISTRLPADRPDIKRSGYAAWRTADRLPTMFGRSLWNVDSYAYLALRIRSDGRSYLINVQTDSMVAPTDLHQHRLFARRPGCWETVVVPWSDFVRTNHGFVVEPQTELLRQRVRSIGLGLTDRVPGPFEVCVARLWATNDPNEAQDVEEDDSELFAAEEAAFAEKEKQASPTSIGEATPLPAEKGSASVTVNIPFSEPSSASPPSPSQPLPAKPLPDSPSKGSGLKDKHGFPVRWDNSNVEK